MKGIILTLIVSMFASRMSECQKRKSEPTSPTEILNITGHWVYKATLTHKDSSWNINPTSPDSSNLKITSSGDKFTGVLENTNFQFCRQSGCVESVPAPSNITNGKVDLANQVTFPFVISPWDTIKHSGLVNVIRTDLPPGSPIRMMMSGTAVIKIKRSKVDSFFVQGPFSAERMVYKPKRLIH